MNNVINKALEIVLESANKYHAESNVYWIEMGTHEDRMNEHPSMENYCAKCIDGAVLAKKQEFFLDRTVEMGKIYEYQQCGFYREPHLKWNKEGNISGLIIKRVKSKEPKDKVVKHLQNNLAKKFPVNMKFSYKYSSCGEATDFDSCESCGVIFNQGLLLSDQEMDHWEGVNDEVLKEDIGDPFQAYQLEKILYDYHEEHEYADRIAALAKRIVGYQTPALLV